MRLNKFVDVAKRAQGKMELVDYLQILRKRWMSVVAIVLLAVALASLYTLGQPKVYASTAQLFFSVQMGSSNADLAQGSTYTERQMASFGQAARSPLVMDPVIEQLGLDLSAGALAGKIQVATPTSTVIMRITASDESPDVAAHLANAVTQQLIATIPVLTPPLEDGTEPIRATILSEAQPGTTPISPSIPMNIALAVILGLAAGFGLALVWEVLDTRVRTSEDIAAITDHSVIGAIPTARNGDDVNDHPIVRTQPHSQRAEAIRYLRTNLQFIGLADQAKTIVITSAVPGEGKSTVALNLAIALSDTGARVALVDADLRRPTVHKKLGLEGSLGLTTVLIGRASLNDALQPWQGTRLNVLTAGQNPPNPSELLGSAQMVQLISSLASTHDFVLFDAPPLLPVTDGAVMSRLAGATLLVVGADRAHRKEVTESLSRLENVNANLAGIVLNKIDQRSNDTYDYGYLAETEQPETQKRKRAKATTR